MNTEEKESSFEVWRLVTSIYKVWYREAERRLSNEDVSIMEYRILRQLTESGPQPMVKLAERNMITQGWVTSLIDRLETRKYVERVRSNTDRRVVNIGATYDGTMFYKKIMELHEAFIAKTLEFMDQDDKSKLKSLLLRIEDQLMNKDVLPEEPVRTVRK